MPFRVHRFRRLFSLEPGGSFLLNLGFCTSWVLLGWEGSQVINLWAVVLHLGNCTGSEQQDANRDLAHFCVLVRGTFRAGVIPLKTCVSDSPAEPAFLNLQTIAQAGSALGLGWQKMVLWVRNFVLDYYI